MTNGQQNKIRNPSYNFNGYQQGLLTSFLGFYLIRYIFCEPPSFNFFSNLTDFKSHKYIYLPIKIIFQIWLTFCGQKIATKGKDVIVEINISTKIFHQIER